MQLWVECDCWEGGLGGGRCYDEMYVIIFLLKFYLGPLTFLLPNKFIYNLWHKYNAFCYLWGRVKEREREKHVHSSITYVTFLFIYSCLHNVFYFVNWG